LPALQKQVVAAKGPKTRHISPANGAHVPIFFLMGIEINCNTHSSAGLGKWFLFSFSLRYTAET
jgi:hypothetical protein